MKQFPNNNVLARVNFTVEEHQALKDHALSYEDGTAIASYAKALEWFLKLPPKKEHRFFYASTKSAKSRAVWINNELYSKVEKLAETSDQSIARVVYTAIIKYLIAKGYLV